MTTGKLIALEDENAKLKKEVENLRIKLGESPKEKQTCEYCSHFQQHYIHLGTGYTEIYDGHCACLKTRTKKRKPDDTACAYYDRKYGKKPWKI